MFCKSFQRSVRTSNVTRRFLLLALGMLVTLPAQAQNGRVFPEGQQPKDSRLGELKHLNAYFPFQPPATLKQWEKRAKALRKQILVANGFTLRVTMDETGTTTMGIQIVNIESS